jgi:hypothetical protein
MRSLTKSARIDQGHSFFTTDFLTQPMSDSVQAFGFGMTLSDSEPRTRTIFATRASEILAYPRHPLIFRVTCTVASR